MWMFVLAPPILTFILNHDTLVWSVDDIFRKMLQIYISSIGIGVGIWIGYRMVLPRVFARVSSTPLRAISHAVTVLSSVTLGFFLCLAFRPMICESEQSFLIEFAETLYIGTVISTIFVAVVLTYQRLRRQAHDVESRAQLAQQAALRANLRALRARTNPHFLFNSLNAVADLVHEDPVRAEAVIERLSDVFRYALESSRYEWVTLDRELGIIDDYLEIELIRLGSRLQVERSVDPTLRKVAIPPLLIQPLVENAVKHGPAACANGGMVTIIVERHRSDFEVAIRNPVGEATQPGTGTSLTDLRQRLALAYGGRAKLSVLRADDHHEVRLRLPMEPQKALRPIQRPSRASSGGLGVLGSLRRTPTD